MSSKLSNLPAATTPLTGSELCYVVQGGVSNKTTASNFYYPGGTDIVVADGGTGASSLTGILQGHDASAFTAVADSSTIGQILRVTGAATYGWGALDLADTDAITNDLPFANLTQGTARSVLGVTGNSTADNASIQSGSAGQVLNSTATAALWTATPTITTSITSPLIIGGTATSSTLILESTSGAGATDLISFKTGSQSERWRIDTNGNWSSGNFASPVGQFSATATVNVNQGTSGYSYSANGFGNNSGALAIAFLKTRGAGPSSHTTVQNGDAVGTYAWGASDGSAYQDLAELTAFIDSATISGSSMPGRITLSTTPVGSVSPTERFRIDNAGNVRVNTAAISTSASDGFLYIPTCAGTPTGTPTAVTGLIPMIYDTTNHQFWFYDTAWKQPKTPAGAAVVTWQ